ncbi:MAG: aminotransferase class III-fold pyridoxal phosphate-dependent enzyme [Pseudomonadota bacterium]
MPKLSWPFIKGRDLKISRAQGVYLYKDSGEPIIDAAGGAIVANVGHGRTEVIEAMAKAATDTSYVVPPWITPAREDMLEQLTDWLPEDLVRVHATSGGTEANEAAMKIALHYQQAIGQSQRTKIVGRSISYHGTTLATASISGHPARKAGLEGALPTFPEVAAPYPLRCPLGSFHQDCGDYYVDLFRDLIEREGSDTIAALLAEPITGSSGGAIVPPDDYWPKVAKLCSDNGILLIMDEVMTGFGRTGRDFGHQHWNIQPDILVSGKGLAGGYAPLGGVFAKDQIGSAIQEAGFQVMFNTFGAHPIACAAAAKVLHIMRDDDLVDRSRQLGAYLHAQLHAVFDGHPNVAEIRGKGLFAGLELVANKETLEKFDKAAGLSGRVVADALDHGVFFYGGGTGEVRDIVCMGPPFVIREQEIDTVVSVLQESIDRVVERTLAS